MQKVRLFLSSPGDVEPERQKVPAVVAQINRMLGDRHGFFLEVIDWKTHVAPDMGRPQEVINRQIGGYDIFVGIMWKRFGAPTGMADSGTEEEFRIAYANWQTFGQPRILFYFSLAPYYPRSKEEIDQWGRVVTFKEKFQRIGLSREYQTPDQFADLLREHLAKVLDEWFPPKRDGRQSSDGTEKSDESKAPPKAPIAPDFSRYINYLKAETCTLISGG